MNKWLTALFFILTLSGCSHRALSEGERAALLQASEKQALENARAQYPIQKAQAAKKAFIKHYDNMEIKRGSDGILTVDGKPAAVIETTESATVYSQGIFDIIVYKSGKVAVNKNGVFDGFAR